MTIQEAIKSHRPFGRPHWNHGNFLRISAGEFVWNYSGILDPILLSFNDVMAENWRVLICEKHNFVTQDASWAEKGACDNCAAERFKAADAAGRFEPASELLPRLIPGPPICIHRWEVEVKGTTSDGYGIEYCLLCGEQRFKSYQNGTEGLSKCMIKDCPKYAGKALYCLMHQEEQRSKLETLQEIADRVEFPFYAQRTSPIDNTYNYHIIIGIDQNFFTDSDGLAFEKKFRNWTLIDDMAWAKSEQKRCNHGPVWSKCFLKDECHSNLEEKETKEEYAQRAASGHWLELPLCIQCAREGVDDCGGKDHHLGTLPIDPSVSINELRHCNCLISDLMVGGCRCGGK
jgi:hypothetical protein